MKYQWSDYAGGGIVTTGTEQASAVIFPANKSSQKAFEKAGFHFLSGGL